MRDYKRQRGSRSYLTGYAEEQMEGALNAVRAGRLSFAKAAIEFHVPKTTLLSKFSGHRTKKSGGQTFLSNACESAIVLVLNQLVDWGLGIT